jgi:hypothetical protein
MISLKRWIFAILLTGLLALTLFAAVGAVGAHQSRAELQQARKVTLGTLVCRKTSENTWAGTTRLHPPYVFAHGIRLIQPESTAEPWKGAKVRATLLIEGANDPVVFQQSGDFWAKEGRE